MRFSVRVFFAIFVFAFFLFIPSAHGQTQNTPTITPVNSFNQPNVDANVPLNQHTFAQSVLIEVMAALSCQLAGIDPINPLQPCLSINPQTNRLGYGPSPVQDGEIQIGGLIGVSVNMISALYTPTTSSGDYVRYLSSNFGITKPVYAAPTSAFEGFAPIMPLWIASRNIAYFLIMLVLLFIGLGVMLRIKIDPRTVMTIQNQIPRVIIALIMITFSYAISAAMADLMWTITYVGINQITSTQNTRIPCTNTMTVNSQATNTILQVPMAFVNSVFIKDCRFVDSGLLSLTSSISFAMGDLLANIIRDLFGVKPDTGCFEFKPAPLWTFIIPPIGIFATAKETFNPGACFGAILNFFTTSAMLLIVFVAIMISLFRIWFTLLKAYIYIFIYTIGAPIWFAFGLIPGRPLGVERWMRGYGANLLTFPLTAFCLVGARVFLDIFSVSPQDKFIPPLIGNPNMDNFGALIAFGFIMLTPTLHDILQEKMKVQSLKQGAAVGAGLAAGAAVPGAIANKGWKHLNRRDQQGRAIGPVSRAGEALGNKLWEIGAKMKVPGAKGALEKRQHVQEYGTLHGYRPGQAQARKDEAFHSAAKEAPHKYGGTDGQRKWEIDQQIANLETKKGSAATWRGRRAQAKIDRLRAERARLTPDSEPPTNEREEGPEPGSNPVRPTTPKTPTGGGAAEAEPEEEGPEPAGAGQPTTGPVNVEHVDTLESHGDVNVHSSGSGTERGKREPDDEVVRIPIEPVKKRAVRPEDIVDVEAEDVEPDDNPKT